MSSLSLISLTFWKDFADHDRGEPECGFVEQEQVGRAHQTSADGEHLLLTTGHLAGHVAALLVQDGEELDHRLQPPPFLRLVGEVEAAHLEVLLDREMGEHATSLGDEANALFDDLVRLGLEPLASPVDFAGDDRRQTHDRLEHGRFARAVRTHHGDRLALADAQRDAVERTNRAVVDGDVGQLQRDVGCGIHGVHSPR